MKVLILDIYPPRPYRISKDTIGGYGTGNDFGDGVVARTLRFLMARSVDWPPLYSVHTAGVLREKGHDVTYSRKVPEDGGFDLCLLTSSIVACETETEAIRQVRKLGVPVGTIGPFATSVPKPYLEAGAFVISGEPEMFFLATELDQEYLSSLSGILPPAPVVELDELPLPAWDLIYKIAPPKFELLGTGFVMLPINATRGCPYSCFYYCVYPLQQGRKMRFRAPEKVVAEMAHWQDTLGVSGFIFRDPVFSINREHTLALCDAINRSGRRFRFIVETHLKDMDEELASRLIEAGMVMVKVGIESVDKDVLNDAQRISLQRAEEVERIRMLQRLRAKVTCMYILGMPKDTWDSCAATIEYAKKLNSTFAQFSTFTPYPGTPAFPEFENRILVDRYEDFTQYHQVFKHDTLSPEDIRSLLDRAYHRYYLRLSWLANHLYSRLSGVSATKSPRALTPEIPRS